MKILVSKVYPNPEQPRTIFTEDEMAALTQSIKANGLVQPITVESTGDGYILVDGERRWRAHRILGLETIEAHIRPETNHNGRERLMHAMVANIQRSGMGPVDEANAYKRLVDEMGSITVVAEHVGIVKSAISLRLRILDLDEGIQRLFNIGALPLDNVAVYGLFRLPEDARMKVAMTAATRHATGALLRKLIRQAEKEIESGVVTNQRPVKEPRVRVTHLGHFNAMALISDEGRIDREMRRKVEETCVECPLYSDAGPRTCRECPMVAFLKKM